MPTLTFDGQHYATQPGETVLNCLDRHGVSVNSSCRAGVCQSCMMVALKGAPGKASQAGLKDILRQQNHFLACSCVPEDDMTITLPDSALTRFESRVVAIDRLNEKVIRLRLSRPPGYDYLPGQFLTLFNDQGIGCSYSLASVPVLDDFLELHVRETPGGRVSGWVARLAAGDKVVIAAASGQCVYLAGKPEQPLLLVGTGTGLAPLLGIVRDALRQGHAGPIHLYHGSSYRSGLYLVDALLGMARCHPNFHYHPCVSRETGNEHYRSGRAAEIAAGDTTNLSACRVFLCGNEAMVKGMQKRAFLAGASMQDIFADPFIKTVDPSSTTPGEPAAANM